MEPLDGVKAMFKQVEANYGVMDEIIKRFLLVNQHWSSRARSATTMLRAKRDGVPLRLLVEVATHKSTNLRSL